ncbi:MAG: site-2 protease family protein [Anaerolineales bacterium]
MNRNKSAFLGKFDQDRTFWLIVGGLILVYALLNTRAVLPIIFSLVGLLLAVTVHECAHAWLADRLGDPTARLRGRVSLNPLVHLDPMGTVMMVITVFTGMGIGWGKPVPVNPYQLKYGRRFGEALVALAGPVANLLLAAIVGLVARLMGGNLFLLYYILRILVMTNVVIAVFNLLPFPPLDGHSVLLGLLSLSNAEWVWRLSEFVAGWERYGAMILLGVILVSQFMGLNIIGALIGPPTQFFLHLILG